MINPGPFLYSIYRACVYSDYYFINDYVQYYDPSKGVEDLYMATEEQYDPLRTLMYKDRKYEWQKEYRIAIGRDVDDPSPLTLEIGDILDHVRYIDVDKRLAEARSSG